MTTLAFLDTETTGLDPDLHEIWEVGLILRDESGLETEKLWHLPVDLSKADPMALNIGRFHERYGCAPAETIASRSLFGAPMYSWAQEFVTLTRDAHLVGAVISFDAERLWKLLRRWGQCPMWHYHLVDVEALAAGYIAARVQAPDFDDDEALRTAVLTAKQAPLWKPPWRSDELTAALGIAPDVEGKHTALGDARWARAIYDRVMA